MVNDCRRAAVMPDKDPSESCSRKQVLSGLLRVRHFVTTEPAGTFL